NSGARSCAPSCRNPRCSLTSGGLPTWWRTLYEQSARCSSSNQFDYRIELTARGRSSRSPEGELMHVDIDTNQGAVRGQQRPDHQAFLGIPFAAPPVGALRFAAPGPAPTWSERRDALQVGPSCPQPYRIGVSAKGPLSEDCLYLNVFTPVADGRARA